jgi:hypothetical protein
VDLKFAVERLGGEEDDAMVGLLGKEAETLSFQKLCL